MACDRKSLLIGIGVAVLLCAVVIAIAVPLSLNQESTSTQHARDLMDKVPLVDGHNDLPWQLKTRVDNILEDIDLNDDLTQIWDISHTDIPRLKEGKLGAQFWAAYVPCDSQYKDAVRFVLEQIDIVKRFSEQYSDTFSFVTTAQGIWDAHENGKIASMIGIEGGHAIDSSLSNLRMVYELGARYITITHSCNTPWCDNWKVSDPNLSDEEPNIIGGCTDFGEKLIREMNRIGMIIDLSHVSVMTMNHILDITTAPVIFSHSSAFEMCNHYRNVPDDVLSRMEENGGVVMVNFYNTYINCTNSADVDTPIASLEQVVDHIEHIKSVCGAGCVGIGGDYDGVDYVPDGLEDVSKYPNLIARLIEKGWSDEDLEKLIGRNLIRAFEEVEKVRDDMQTSKVNEGSIPRNTPGEVNNTCRHYVFEP